MKTRKKNSWLKTARKRPFSVQQQILVNQWEDTKLHNMEHHQMFTYGKHARIWYKYNGTCPCKRCTRKEWPERPPLGWIENRKTHIEWPKKSVRNELIKEVM